MTMKIALVPYKPGQEPEGMVSSLDPEQYDEKGVLDADIDNAETHLTAIAAAIKAAKRDPWEEWVDEVGGTLAAYAKALDDMLGREVAGAVIELPELAEALREAGDTAQKLREALVVKDDQGRRVVPPSAVLAGRIVSVLESALRKAGAPVDEPESAEDVPSPEERNRRQREGLCRLCGGLKGRLRFWCPACDSATNAAVRDDLDNNREEMCRIDEELAAEDVTELWVSRDELCADVWRGKPRWSEMCQYFCLEEDAEDALPCLPPALADALSLQPGDCRRVTKQEYERYFREVLDLPQRERYAALERMVP